MTNELPPVLDCPHYNEHLIEDSHEGTIICTNCSRSVQNICSQPVKRMEDNNVKLISLNSPAEEELEELYQRGYFPFSIFLQVLIEANRLKCEELKRRKKVRATRNCKSFCYQKIIAYSLYWTLIDFDCPHSPEEVCSWFQLPTNVLWEIAKVHELTFSNKKVLDEPVYCEGFLNRFSNFLSYDNELDWTFKDTKKVFQIANHLRSQTRIFHSNTRPQCLAAAIIYIYYQWKKDSKHVDKFFCKKLSDICHVSPVNLRKIVKTKLDNIDVAHVLKFYSDCGYSRRWSF